MPCSKPCFDALCQLPLGTSCLLHAKLCHSTPENIGDRSRTSQGHFSPYTRTLSRAHSIAEFPRRYSEHAPGQNFVKSGTHLKDRTEAEQDTRTQNPLYLAPIQLSHVLPASQKKGPYWQDQYKPSALSCRKASQETLSEYLCLDNQLGQDSRSCSVPSCLTAELLSLSSEEVPVLAKCKLEPSPESRPEEPQGTGQAPEVADKQKHLWDIAVETGNQTCNYTSKYILTEKRKSLARTIFPHHSGNNRSQSWKRNWISCSRGSDGSDVPKTNLKSSATGTSKEVEDVIIQDPNCTKNALQDFSEITSAVVSHCSCRHEECDQGPEDTALPFVGALPLEPKADKSSRGRCALIIVAVEQKGLQATRRRVRPLLETQSCEFLAERPGSPRRAGAMSCESPTAEKPQTPGKECELPAAPRLGGDDGAVQQVPQAAWAMLSTKGAVEEKLPRKSQSSRFGADMEDTTWALSHGPEDPHGTHEGLQGSRAPEGGAVLASALALAASPFRGPCRLSQVLQEPGKHLTLSKLTFRKSQALATQSQGGSIVAQETELQQSCGSALGTKGVPEDHGERLATVAMWQGPSGQDQAPLQHLHGMPSPKIILHCPVKGSAELSQEGDVESAGDHSSRRLCSENCDAKRPPIPEKGLRARLAIAHKTFANFFESKVLDKENTDESSPCSLESQKEKSRLFQNSWRVFLKKKAAKGPKRPSLVSLGPGPEILNSLRLSPGTNSLCEKQVENKESHDFRDYWAFLPSPLSSSNLVSPDSRRKSEPTIQCTSFQENGSYLCSGIFSERSQLMSSTSPCAQKPGVSCSVSSSSTCFLAYGNQSRPSKPLSPKPQSPRPGAQQEDFHYPDRGSATSMVFLGNYSNVDSSSEASGRPKNHEDKKNLLLSLQTLNQNDQKASWKRSQHHHSWSRAPLLRDLPGSECWEKMAVTSPVSLNLSRRSHPFSQSAPTGLNYMGWPEHMPDTGCER